MVPALVRRNSLAYADGVSISCGCFLVAERRSTQGDNPIAVLAGVLIHFTVVAWELQQWTGEPVDYRASHDRDRGGASTPMDTLRSLPRTYYLPKNLSTFRRLAAGAPLSAPTRVAFACDAAFDGRSYIRSSTTGLRTRTVSEVVRNTSS